VIEHRIIIDQIGLGGSGDDQILLRGAAEAVTRCRAVVYIYETSRDRCDERPAAAIIPAYVARELIRKGQLFLPPLASVTVLARDVCGEEASE
jgi:hypothetical protein